MTRVSPRTHTPQACQTHASLSPHARVHAALYARSQMITELHRVRALLASGKKTPGQVWALSGVEPRAELRGPALRAGACPRRRDLRRSALGPFAALPASSPQPPP